MDFADVMTSVALITVSLIWCVVMAVLVVRWKLGIWLFRELIIDTSGTGIEDRRDNSHSLCPTYDEKRLRPKEEKTMKAIGLLLSFLSLYLFSFFLSTFFLPFLLLFKYKKRSFISSSGLVILPPYYIKMTLSYYFK